VKILVAKEEEGKNILIIRPSLQRRHIALARTPTVSFSKQGEEKGDKLR
jgi:hypothetical protein